MWASRANKGSGGGPDGGIVKKLRRAPDNMSGNYRLGSKSSFAIERDIPFSALSGHGSARDKIERTQGRVADQDVVCLSQAAADERRTTSRLLPTQYSSFVTFRLALGLIFLF